MARFLLIHGSCHGAWCWRDVLPLLHAAGHEAQAIDLPSHGADRTPPSEVTLDLYARTIVDAIDQPVTLVGHSMAGYPISLAAELAPEKVARLVYLCAYVPAPGMSLVDMRRAGPRQPLMDAIVTAPDKRSFTFDPAKVGDKLYHDCPGATLGFALPRLCPQAILPQATPVVLTRRYGAVERHYIRCTDDRTIPPEYQATMSDGWPSGTVTTLPSGHSPFFACPNLLAQRLVDIAV
jgi:pimeloyl-ACP methyl ester carboxylesterase